MHFGLFPSECPSTQVYPVLCCVTQQTMSYLILYIRRKERKKERKIDWSPRKDWFLLFILGSFTSQLLPYLLLTSHWQTTTLFNTISLIFLLFLSPVIKVSNSGPIIWYCFFSVLCLASLPASGWEVAITLNGTPAQ